GAASGGVHVPAMVRLGDLQPLFSDETPDGGPPGPGGCVVAGCHDPLTPQAMLDLSDGDSYANLVGVPSTERTPLRRVVAGDPTNSYLLRKLLGTPDI